MSVSTITGMISRSRNREGSILRWVAALLGVSHLAFVAATGTLRWEHVAADALLVTIGWTPARRFLWGGLPLWLTGVILDNQRFWLHLRGPVHTGDLWELERALFPVTLDGSVTTWPAYFAARPNVVLDALCGLGYATYLLEFLVLLVVLFFRRDGRFELMGWAFFAVSALGCLTYVLYPAAPPWYVMEHGMGPADLAAQPSAAGAARFDALFGVSYFADFYSRNPNVMGAMPSLHLAYPVVGLWQIWHLGKWWRTGAAAFTGLVAFSAVYLSHHYILDVLAGVLVAVVACWALDLVASPKPAPALVITGDESHV
jgi:inositol phosphorylceramide synthase catalytic subunit